MLLVEKLTWPCLKMVSRTCHLWETDPLDLGLSYAENSPATPATQTVLVLMATNGFPQGMDPMHVPGSSGEYVGDLFAKSEKWLGTPPRPDVSKWNSREAEILGWQACIYDLTAWAMQASLGRTEAAVSATSFCEGFLHKFEHPMSTTYYFSLLLILSVTHVQTFFLLP